MPGEPLAHQRRHASYVGRRLAGSTETLVVGIQGSQCRFPASRSDDFGLDLDPAVGSGAPAAVRLDGVHVVPRGRPHRQHAGVGAFPGVVNAAVPGVVLDRINAPNCHLNPVWQTAALVMHHYVVYSGDENPKSQRFVWIVSSASRLRVIANQKQITGGRVPNVKVEIAGRSTPAIVPPQLDSNRVPLLKERHIVAVIRLGELEVDKPTTTRRADVGTAGEPGSPSIIARCVDPNDSVVHRPVHGF